MICLDSARNIIRNDDYLINNGLSGKEYLIIDDWENGEYHFEEYDSEKLIYLSEYDLVYSIADLEKGILYTAPKRTGKDTVHWITGPLINIIEIPQLKKLLKNKMINKTNASTKIKERDDDCCQLCGESDYRTLNVHHIVPRKSPFIHKSFIHSPMNQITLCANCHSIEHHVMRYGNDDERREHVERLFRLNGFNWDKYHRNSEYYISIKEIEAWNTGKFKLY